MRNQPHWSTAHPRLSSAAPSPLPTASQRKARRRPPQSPPAQSPKTAAAAVAFGWDQSASPSTFPNSCPNKDEVNKDNRKAETIVARASCPCVAVEGSARVSRAIGGASPPISFNHLFVPNAEKKFVKRSLRRDAANSTRDACAPTKTKTGGPFPVRLSRN